MVYMVIYDRFDRCLPSLYPTFWTVHSIFSSCCLYYLVTKLSSILQLRLWIHPYTFGFGDVFTEYKCVET